MKNRYKVVKTTTNESNGVVHSRNKDLLVVVRDWHRKSLKEKFPHLSYYHLHIVDTQATIEVGDWYCSSEVYCPNEDKHPPIWQRVNTILPPGEPNDYKIVASTDPSLNLPMIPENFIEAFASNQGIKIADITFFDDKVEITCNDVDLYYTDNSTQKALNWWNNLNSFEQDRLTYLIKGDVYDNLSTKEIEAAYNKYAGDNSVLSPSDIIKLEDLPKILEGKSISNDNEIVLGESQPMIVFEQDTINQNEEPEVDFELLKKFIANIDKVDRISTKMAENAILFFNQLKTNTNFAMEVHKRLQ